MPELEAIPDGGVFELRAARLPAGWVELDLEIAGAVPSAPRLLVDEGAGFSAAGTLVLPLPRGGRVRTVVELPRQVRRLGLETGGVAPGRIVARELGPLETAVRLAIPIVRRRLAEPWTIPQTALKFARALLSGELMHGMLQRQIHEEPQLFYERWYRRYGELTDADRAAIRADPVDVRISVIAGNPGGQLYPARDGGEWKVVLADGDQLTEHALYLLAKAIAAHPDAEVVYGDEDAIDAQGRLHSPLFKPDWNPDLLFSTNYISRAFASRIGNDYASLLKARRVEHVPFVILHRRGEPPAVDRAALQEHLGTAATVEPDRVRWKVPSPAPRVSLVIPTRDGRALLETCVESLLRVTAYRNFEILVVDNQSSDPAALEYLGKLEQRGVARVLRYPHPFNFPAINNFAVAQASGEVVGLLNNDLEFVEPGWLTEMVSHALRPDVGCVGAKLLYPDRTVQHAGVVLGIGGVADHLHKNLPQDAPGYCGRARVVQDFSAVTAACLLVRRQTWNEVGGFDEKYAVAFNDVDFCLRVRERGLRNVWTPFATVIHHESKSRGRENTPAKWLRFRGEMARLRKRWGPLLADDPAYNPNLTLDAKNVSLAWPPRAKKPWR